MSIYYKNRFPLLSEWVFKIFLIFNYGEFSNICKKRNSSIYVMSPHVPNIPNIRNCQLVSCLVFVLFPLYLLFFWCESQASCHFSCKYLCVCVYACGYIDTSNVQCLYNYYIAIIYKNALYNNIYIYIYIYKIS